MIKSKFFSFIFAILFVFCSIVPSYGSGSTVRVIDNGSILKFPVPAQIVDNRVLVPMRELCEQVLGCTVTWNNSDKSVTVTNGTTTLKMKIGDTTMYLNGTPVITDVPPQIISDTTFIPHGNDLY